MKHSIPVLGYLLVFLISLITNEFNYALVIILLTISLISILDKMGRGIILRESVAFLYILICLVMPLIGYEVYNINNPMSRIFLKYMLVPQDIYFGFTIPALSAFCLAITFPFYKSSYIDEGARLNLILEKCKRTLQHDRYLGMIIIAVGLTSFLISQSLPASLRYIGIILFFSSFAGLLYVHFAPGFRNKSIIILVFISFLILNAIAIGMFTIVAYMGITIFSFFFLGKKVSLFRKMAILLAGVFILIIIQNTKVSYRRMVWDKTYEGNQTTLFINLFVENLQKGDVLFEKDAFFPLYVRSNQGYNIALVMRRIPAVKPFDSGEAIATAILSSFVPRFLWPDKPEAGGKFNMQYFAGKKILTWSTNVGPLGEAYGSFGVRGGIIYMFFLGFFIRWVYGRLFKFSLTSPLVILWIPVLFYQVTYSAETDTLQIVNSMLKTTVFMWVLYKIFPRWFGIRKESHKQRVQLMTKPA